MRRTIGLIGTAVLILIAAVPALAKGPASATITGPAIDEPIELFDQTDSDQSKVEEIRKLIEQSGLWYATPTLERIDPPAEPGRPLILTWGEGQHAIQQEIYLHAESGPAIHTLENQPALKGWGGEVTGWFRAPADLEDTLQALGVPTDGDVSAKAPAALGLVAIVAFLGFLATRLVNSRLRFVGSNQ
ncbi:MAG: hypothetical protein ACRDVL_07160 [Acidimicrobiia bacterium]